MSGLRPFWRYYGGKWRAAPRYPTPEYRAIVEPFAGAAGYSLRYPSRDVVLVDKYPVICEIWRYLIAAKPSEILRIPTVDSVDDLPAWVPSGARYLVGFAMNDAAAAPRKTLSSGCVQMREMGRVTQGWSEAMRARVARQVEHIRHWRIVEGDYTAAPDIDATWFIDPPYQDKGFHYVHNSKAIDFAALGAWCQSRRGQVIACENDGASWLPFDTFATFKAGINGAGSREVIWTNRPPKQTSMF